MLNQLSFSRIFWYSVSESNTAHRSCNDQLYPVAGALYLWLSVVPPVGNDPTSSDFRSDTNPSQLKRHCLVENVGNDPTNPRLQISALPHADSPWRRHRESNSVYCGFAIHTGFNPPTVILVFLTGININRLCDSDPFGAAQQRCL